MVENNLASTAHSGVRTSLYTRGQFPVRNRRATDPKRKSMKDCNQLGETLHACWSEQSKELPDEKKTQCYMILLVKA